MSWFSCYVFCFFVRCINSFPQILLTKITQQSNGKKAVHIKAVRVRDTTLVSRMPCIFDFVLFRIHVHLSLKSNRINYNLNYLTFWLWFHKSFSRFTTACHFGFCAKSITIARTIASIQRDRRNNNRRIQKKLPATLYSEYEWHEQRTPIWTDR